MATYDVTVIDTFEFDSSYGIYSSIAMLDATHFAVAYRGNGSDGFLKTLSIDSNYDNIAEIDVLEHDTVSSGYNSTVRIDDTHFILAYSGSNDDGYVKTFSVDSNYDNITQIDSLEHDTAEGKHNSLVKIDSTHYALAYASAYGYSKIKVFSIDGSYDNITEVGTLTHETVSGSYNGLVMIDSTHLALAYAGSGDDGFIKTFSIDGSYNITEIDSLEHELVAAIYTSFIKIDATHFMLSYAGTAGTLDSVIKTFSIDGSYDNITEIDALTHDTGITYGNALTMMDSTHFMFSYTTTNQDAYIKIFSIDGSYDTITQESVLQYESSTTAAYGSMITIDATHTILAYTRTAAYGYAKTFVFEPPAAGGGVRCRVFGGPFWGPLGGPI